MMVLNVQVRIKGNWPNVRIRQKYNMVRPLDFSLPFWQLFVLCAFKNIKLWLVWKKWLKLNVASVRPIRILGFLGDSSEWKNMPFFSEGEMFGYTATLWKNHEYSDWPDTRPLFSFLGKAGRRLWRMANLCSVIHFTVAQVSESTMGSDSEAWGRRLSVGVWRLERLLIVHHSRISSVYSVSSELLPGLDLLDKWTEGDVDGWGE